MPAEPATGFHPNSGSTDPRSLSAADHHDDAIAISRRRPENPASGGAIWLRSSASSHLYRTEVAALLGVPTSTAHHWAREGTIPSRKLGKGIVR
jgi:hypothetical protein